MDVHSYMHISVFALPDVVGEQQDANGYGRLHLSHMVIYGIMGDFPEIIVQD